jgi:hypothetical protein
MKRQHISITFLAFLLLLQYPEAGVAQRRGATAYDRARASLTGPHQTAFTDIVARTRARGLPTEPLVDKVLEGKAKRVPPDKIIQVVRQRVDQLARAQGVVRSRTPVDIIAVADALQRGVSEGTIRRIHAEAGAREPVALAVHTLADLLDSGVSSDVALNMIAGWRSRGGAPSELRELPAAVERLVREGADPGRAGNAVASALRSGRSASSVRMALELKANPSPSTNLPGVGRAGPGAAQPPAPGKATGRGTSGS